MKFYIVNKELDAEIENIQLQIRLSISGITSESMTEKGVSYTKNYGVTVPVLREIAKSIEPSLDLANRLWLIGWRETLIVSVLLQPVESFTPDMALQRITTAPQKEIIDILCLYLLSKTKFATELCVKLVCSENENCRMAGFMLASRIYTALSDEHISILIEKSVELSQSNNFQLYNSIGICMGRLCRTNKGNAQLISNIIERFKISPMPSLCSIANEVKQELDFLDDLFDK